MRTVAAPLYDHSGQVQAAVNVSGHAGRVSMAELRRDYLPRLLDTARQISGALGARETLTPRSRAGKVALDGRA